MAAAIATVTNSIAALSVSGVTLKDMDEILEQVEERDGPIIQPIPNGFVTDLGAERDSFGDPSQALKTLNYTLNYRLMYIPLDAGRGLFDVYDDMVAKAFLFIDAVLANDDLSGSVDVTPVGALNFGPVVDPAGNQFHGCDFQLRVQEFVN